ncbi:MAG: hypothetical protein H7Z43_01045 [Clostridia bacterium]|nr:hypothetical protein [Deltaproteobacteria bacterium]
MLIWYANIPEETEFYQHRIHGVWLVHSIVLLFGHFAIPFAGLLSRHVKRNRKALAFFACWLLVWHYVDVSWWILPTIHEGSTDWPLTVLETLGGALAFVGVGGIVLATVGFLGSRRSLVALKDPRVAEALTFENV